MLASSGPLHTVTGSAAHGRDLTEPNLTPAVAAQGNVKGERA